MKGLFAILCLLAGSPLCAEQYSAALRYDSSFGGYKVIIIPDAFALYVPNGIVDVSGNALYSTIAQLLSSTNNANLSVNLGSAFDPLGRATETTNTARLVTQLGSSFATAQSVLDATNTASLAVNLGGNFDALNAALNATNTAHIAIQLGSPLTNGQSTAITVSNTWTFKDSNNAQASITNGVFVGIGTFTTLTNAAGTGGALQKLDANKKLVDAGAGIDYATTQNVVDSTNTTRLASQLSASFTTPQNVIDATNTTRLATQLSLTDRTNVTSLGTILAGTFDSLNAAVNSTNAARIAIQQDGLSSGNGASMTNLQISKLQAPTNSASQVVSFSFTAAQVIGEFATNATFTWLAPTGVSSTNYQSYVVMVTNSAASTINMTVPANCITNAADIWNVTNAGLTRITFENWGGKYTNAWCRPLR